MNIKKIFAVLVLSMTLSVAFSLFNMQSAHAQDCTDATGAPIECPPSTDDTGSGDTGSDDTSSGDTSSDDSGGKRNTPVPPIPTSTPIPTFTPTPTATLSTIANPTDDPGLEGVGWSGTCSGTPKETTRCIGVFTNACEHVGGSADGNVQKDGKVKMTCTVPSNALPIPTIRPIDGEGATGGEAEGKSVVCMKNSNVEANHHIDCAMRLTGKCVSNGGSSTSSSDKYGNIKVTCSEDVLDEPLPEDENVLSASATDTDNDITCHDMFCVMNIYIGCWWSNGNYSETANPDGSISVSCEPKSGTGPVNPIPYPGLPLLGLIIIIIAAVVAIPAFLRYRKQRKSDTQLKNKEAVAIYTSTGDQPKPERTPTREHILLNKEDDGAASGDVISM